MPEEAFSSIDLVGQCLIDEPRSKAFEDAIKKAVKPGDTVLDIGTGSGLLAMFAARAGSTNVKAIEFDPYVAETARKNIATNKLSEKITLWEGDGRNFNFPANTHFDVVVMEMLTTGMVDEFQVQAANNLHNKRVVSEKTKFIPSSQQTFVELVYKDFSLYGLEFKMVQHLWNNLSENQKYRVLSEKVLLNDVSFSEVNAIGFSGKVSITPTASDTVNAIRLSSRAFFPDGTPLDDTETFNAPVIIPILETPVVNTVPVILNVSYKFGFGYQGFSAKIA